ncbi:MAG: FAD-binding protein [Solirubrobacteraceae bacterium]
MAVPRVLTGWGGGAGASVRLVRPRELGAVAELLASLPGESAIVRGMGRAYGDAAQLTGGIVIDATLLRSFAIDRRLGTVTAQAGATLGGLLGALAGTGWSLPVVPGTQHVTIGGAIASDVHGKNHGCAGSFGDHVQALGLLTADGRELELSREHDPSLFAATIGGMGLTGMVAWARVKLVAAGSGWVSVDTTRVDGIDAAISALSAPGGEHGVAWLDLLGAAPARGVVTRAAELDADPAGRGAGSRTVAARAALPARWSRGVLRPVLLRAYNELRYRRAPRHEVGRAERFGPHQFALDALGGWPRLYGAGGFVQYQFVVPVGQERTVERVITRLRKSPVPCYLAVLKRLGAGNESPLYFPLAGWTLALDMPGRAPGLESLQSGFDDLVLQAGGRVYLTKDARLSPGVVGAMYPALERWRSVRDRVDPDGRWRSDLGSRTGLVDGPR